jgi:hypothetical protein
MRDQVDPAAAAFARWQQIERESSGLSDAGQADWLQRSTAAAAAVVAARATSPAGLAAKLQLVQADDGSPHAPALLAQVVAALLAME